MYFQFLDVQLYCGTKEEVEKTIQEQSKKVSNNWIFLGVAVCIVGVLCYFFLFHTSSNEEKIPDVHNNPKKYFPSVTDLVIKVKEITPEESIDKETTQSSLSAGHSNDSNTTVSVKVTDLTTELETEVSELSEKSQSEVVSSLQFTEETLSEKSQSEVVSSLQLKEEKPSVESMESKSESEYDLQKKTSQFPTKEQKAKQKKSQFNINQKKRAKKNLEEKANQLQNTA